MDEPRKFPPPPPQRPNIAVPNAEQQPAEQQKKGKKPMSKEVKMALLISGATASFLAAVVCLVLIFVL